jgi:peptide/nickel transport system substrate-binding protein
MQTIHSGRRKPLASASPAASIGYHLWWQVVLTLIGLGLLASMLGYSTYTVRTVLVPDRGGVYREGVAGTPQYLNPLMCDATSVDLDLCRLIYRGLTTINRSGRVVPDLAAEWEIKDDVEYTFRMKREQFWHDGKPVTADDVMFTIGVLQNPELFSLPDLTSLWRTVQVEKLDDYSVRFRLAEPFTPFLDSTSIGLLPQHIWHNVDPVELATRSLRPTPIGNGPMRVTQINERMVRLEPSAYFRGARPYINALELHFYPDHGSLFTGYLNGEVDGLSQVLPQDMVEAGLRDDLNLFSAMQSSYVSIVFNLNNEDVPFFREAAVRQALAHGLNRNRLVEEAIGGQGIVAHAPLIPDNWAYNHGVKQYEYNLERAQQLLDEAGWVDSNGDGIRDKDGRPLRFLLYANDDVFRRALIEHIAQDWRQIGVEAIPTAVTFAGLVSDFLNPRRFDAAVIGWELYGDPDPYPLWHSTQAVGGGQNYSGWANNEADEIMEQTRATTDEQRRRTLYYRFQDIFADEAPAIVLYYPVYTYGVSNRVHNVQIGSINHSSERFKTFADWYILTRKVPENQVPAAAPPTPPGSMPAGSRSGR